MSEKVEKVVSEGMDAARVARALLEQRFATESGEPGLLFWRGRFIKWNGGQRLWEAVTHKKMRLELWRVMERVTVASSDSRGDYEEGMMPDRDKVGNVLEALESQAEREGPMPAWLCKEDKPPADHCVAFRDVVVDVAGTAEMRRRGEEGYATVERDEGWLGPVVPCEFKPGDKCEVYRARCKEWMPDARDLELRERFYGYCLMGTRKYRRGLSEFGKAHGGKGSWTRLLRKMKGSPWYMGIQLTELSSAYQSAELAMCDTLVVSECNELDSRGGERCASLVKASWGQDDIQLNRKHVEMEGTVLRFAPIFQGNSLLTLPDASGGVSSKLLWINFDRSFVGKEDPKLDEKLEEEMAGIAARWVEAAVRLEGVERMEDRWMMSEKGAKVARRYRVDGNRWDAFVEACFVLAPTGFVSGELVKQRRKEWEDRTGMVLATKNGKRVGDQDLMMRLEEETTLPVSRAKKRVVQGDVEVQRRGLAGVVVRAQMVLGEERE